MDLKSNDFIKMKNLQFLHVDKIDKLDNYKCFPNLIGLFIITNQDVCKIINSFNCPNMEYYICIMIVHVFFQYNIKIIGGK